MNEPEKPIVPDHEFPIREVPLVSTWPVSGRGTFYAAQAEWDGTDLPLEIRTSANTDHDLTKLIKSFQ